MPVESVEELDEHVIIRYTDFVRKERVELIAEQAVFASPSYVAKHVLKSKYWPSYFFEGRKHHPWLIGIVTLKEIPESNGTPLAWDNVKFGTKGLGYVSNRHQEFKQHLDKYVLNVYLALDQNDPVTERRLLFEMSDEQMRRLVLQELESIHPTIAEQIESIDVQRWGHGMITPYPGTFSKYLEYKILDKAARRIHLAHTDYSGYSVFEEAFDLGFLAAQKITQA